MTAEHATHLQALGLLNTYRTMSTTDRRSFIRHIYRLEIGTESRRVGLRFLRYKAEAEAQGTL